MHGLSRALAQVATELPRHASCDLPACDAAAAMSRLSGLAAASAGVWEAWSTCLPSALSNVAEWLDSSATTVDTAAELHMSAAAWPLSWRWPPLRQTAWRL